MADIDEAFLPEVRMLWPEGSQYHVVLTQIEDVLPFARRLSGRTREVLAGLPSFAELESAIIRRKGDADEVAAILVACLWNRLLGRALLKCEDAIRLLIFSTNRRNLYGTALATRTIIEHVGLMTHLSDRSASFSGRELSDAEFTEFMHEMYRLAMGSNVDWEALFSGKTPVRTLIQQNLWKRPKDERLPQLNALVQALDAAMGTRPGYEPGFILLMYGILSDLLHPSWGGDFMYLHLLSSQYAKLVDANTHFCRVLTVAALPISGVLLYAIQLADNLVRWRPGWDRRK